MTTLRISSGAKAVQDASILGHIRRLADESLRLRLQHSPDAEDKERLTQVQVELHQCWDLLRQRRARREHWHVAPRLSPMTLLVKDLSLTEELDSKVMAGVRGGFSGILAWLFPDHLIEAGK
jgi:hypothetical protein